MAMEGVKDFSKDARDVIGYALDLAEKAGHISDKDFERAHDYLKKHGLSAKKWR